MTMEIITSMLLIPDNRLHQYKGHIISVVGGILFHLIDLRISCVVIHTRLSLQHVGQQYGGSWKLKVMDLK
jgi:hypothetical protein